MSGNGNGTDKRLIEDYLPIQAISAEASREKNIRKGHISTLHLWWARRPLVACRAAVYGALVPANRWVKDVDLKNPPADSTKAEAVKNGKAKGLNRAAADRFVTELCQYPGSPRVIQQAQEHILEAHADRLSDELKKAAQSEEWPAWVEEFDWPKDQTQVTRHDIEQGRAPRPRVLDMFAGGGAIPLEALRLGCEAYALDLNPVAHIVQLCTLVYPQQHGKSDSTAPGMTGPAGKDNKPTWGGLADEVRYWGKSVLGAVKAEIGDLYPLVPDPSSRGARQATHEARLFTSSGTTDDLPSGYLLPVAYLWTRTVKCKNRACGKAVPLHKQTWLCKKPGRHVALRVIAEPGHSAVRYEVVEHSKASAFDFDPSAFSTGGNATCPFCRTAIDVEYVKAEGRHDRLGHQLMAVVCRSRSAPKTRYLSAELVPTSVPADRHREYADGVPDEALDQYGMSGFRIQPYGMTRWGHIYSPRQQVSLVAFARAISNVHAQIVAAGVGHERAIATTTMLALALDRLANYLTSLCVWRTARTCVLPTFSRQSVPMVWDYGEMNPFAGSAGDWAESVDHVASVISACATMRDHAHVTRGSALRLPHGDGTLDAVITDPPYYDNVSYANISDFFYVWLKRTIGPLYSEHFSSGLSPKKQEAIANPERDGGRAAAREVYESMMRQSFEQAHRSLKPSAPLVVVYAHKTTVGWATLVDALRNSGFAVTEAWPIDTEMTGGMRAHLASLATSVFLVARKRTSEAGVGSYEDDVYPDLLRIVRERINSLWELDVTGADLVIAAVGAGLRALTRYERVEFANGDVVPAERFLAEVESVVLDVMLERIAGDTADTRGVTTADARSRFYVLWRYVYRGHAVEAGDAIVFTYGQHVELDGQKGLSSGANPLVEKKKGSYRLRDFAERGKDDKLGLPTEDGEAAPLIDALHRILWLMEHSPRRLTEFLRESRCNTDQLRVLAQALSGPALKGGETGQVSGGEELAALTKLTANWRSVIEDSLSPLERSR